MIYFTNTSLVIPHMGFIGRWSPFHKGHTAIIEKKISENPNLPVLIMVRDTGKESYSAGIRAEYIKAWMLEHSIQGTIMIIPNIEGIYWGRGVGYKREMIDIDEKTKKISGTKIRNDITARDADWRLSVASSTHSAMLSPKISRILEHGIVIWLTGCPSSGKTTIAQNLKKQLANLYPHLKIQILDGDDMRASPLAQNVGFSPKERTLHIRRMALFAKMFADHGIFVIAAFVSPGRRMRNEAKDIIGRNRFIEVYVKASQKTRLQRDVKGMYKKALKGKISNFTGLSSPYETPRHPSITCDTDDTTPDECVDLILSHILK